MEYKLFYDYITLQALFKELRIIHSGGAIKSFLADTTVFLNGVEETRRGKKLRIGDNIIIPSQKVEITIVEPTKNDWESHKQDLEEKKRISALVKKLNQENKARQIKGESKPARPIRFPGI